VELPKVVSQAQAAAALVDRGVIEHTRKYFTAGPTSRSSLRRSAGFARNRSHLRKF
jgi:hypothetical protein